MFTCQRNIECPLPLTYHRLPYQPHTHLCRANTFSEFKTRIAARYSVPESHISFFDSNTNPIPDSTSLNEVEGKVIAQVKEAAAASTHGHGHQPRLTAWIFEFDRGKGTTIQREGSTHKYKNTGGMIAADVIRERHGLGLVKSVVYRVPIAPE